MQRPEFITFLSTPPGTIFVTANKVASRFLTNFLQHKKKYKTLFITDSNNNEIIDNESIKHRYLIVREPLDRFFSWYDMFVFKPSENMEPYSQIMGTLDLYDACVNKLSYKFDVIENIHNFLMHYTKEELKHLVRQDSHTLPLSEYFSYTGISSETYNFVDFYSLTNFILEKFGEVYVADPKIKQIKLTSSNIRLLSEIEQIFMEIYKEDYQLISRVKKYEW